MMTENKLIKSLLQSLSYVMVAAVAVFITLSLKTPAPAGEDKLDELRNLIDAQFIGEADLLAMDDAAAAAMVAATGDRWSYYIPASQLAANQDYANNSYVGIGITIVVLEDGSGAQVKTVEPGSGAQEAGILPGDVLTAVEGKSFKDLGLDGATNIIRGEENTRVSLTVLRGEQTLDLSVMRRRLQVLVAKGQMLVDGIGYIKIVNFNDRCAQETIAQIEQLRTQGARSLIFDVRFNPGGYKTELVDLLNYLLPEGEVFRSIYYNGKQTVDKSDAACLDMPIAVLINGESYSAAEFFAAALDEYDRAVVVGEPTVGKSYFQQTIKLKDGSAVALSVGKYVTPKGVTLAEVGGLKPEIEITVDEDTAAKIYGELLQPEEDPQLQAAVEVLKNP